ncbi:hypothetical protein Mag101_06765 [Microbulbifer agarilyticus]|uniref:Uncharacterized protein n=1 Tax=Microbulbifer agarilyticus TaxID=260552 RepID=A0A1Q2M499_9GAMM|nr:hypothetical protein [Microbulbifer agarilyticus]AQQ67368.1 hypothetical protein Mag101_06765 [Microbulbifer agarilyticus]
MNRSLKRGLAASCLLTMVMNLTACGYFLYPERKGQTGGRVDPVVVILDGAALLFGILPGIVAFAVDFTNGTIYLPAGGSSAIDRHISSADDNQLNGANGEVLGKQVIDQNGQAWVELPLEAVGTAVNGDELTQVSAAIRQYTGHEVSVTDVVWVRDLAALQQARSEQFAAAH